MSGFGIGYIAGPDPEGEFPDDDDDGAVIWVEDFATDEAVEPHPTIVTPRPVVEEDLTADIEEPSADLPGGENLVPYSDFESAKGWSASGWEFPYDPSPRIAYHGTRVACLFLEGGPGVMTGETFPIDATDVHWASVASWMVAYDYGSARCWMDQLDVDGVLLQSDTLAEVAAVQTRWNRYSKRVTSTLALGAIVWHPDAVSVRFRAEGSGDMTWYLDAVMLTRGGTLSSFSPRAGENIDGSEVVHGTLPGKAFDTTPPPAPVELVVTSASSLLADGATDVTVTVSFAHPVADDYAGCEVEVTEDSVSDPDVPTLSVPVWSAPKRIFLPPPADGSLTGTVVFHGLRAVTRHWVRARSTDTTGNRSAWSNEVGVVSSDDLDAPGVPNVDVYPMLRGLWVEWTPGTAPDISYYEWRTRPNGSTDDWLSGRIRGSVVTISNLTPDVLYVVQVRAVDSSGNVATSDTDSTPVKAVPNPEAGWSLVDVGEGIGTGTPSLVGEHDITADAVRARHIRAGEVTADKLGAGYIEVRTDITDRPDGIKVLAANGLDWFGRWDEAGMFLRESATNPARHIKLTGGGIYLTDNGGDLVAGGSYQTAITPDGINATKVTFGVLAGGMNLVLNSGFEQNDWGGGEQTPAAHSGGTDWSGNRATATTPTNMNETANGSTALAMSAAS